MSQNLHSKRMSRMFAMQDGQSDSASDDEKPMRGVNPFANKNAKSMLDEIDFDKNKLLGAKSMFKHFENQSK